MKKYVSPLTSKLTPDNWKETINLKDLSLDDLTDLLGDLKAMEKFGKQVGGFVKEAVFGRMPDDVFEHATDNFAFAISDRSRKAGLDEEKITVEMGEEWLEAHRKPPIEFKELRMTKVEAA